MSVISLNKEPTNKSVFIWNLIGSIANSFLSVVALMIVTRSLDVKQTDIFSIAWSISQLMATIGTFQVRTFQATDVKENYKFGQYLLFRIATLIIMIVASIGYVFINGFNLYKSFIVIILCLFRAIESLMDVYEGYFQQKERLDLVGKATTFRVVLSLIFFTAISIITRNVIACSITLVAVYAISFLVFDLRYAKYVEKFKLNETWDKSSKWWIGLFKECVPIFVNSFLMMLITNAPKMMIDKEIADGNLANGAQTVFNILFMPASVLTLVYIVFRPLMTRMAIEWNEGRKKEYLKIIFLMLGCLVGVAVIFVLAGYVLGIPVLSLLYSLDLSNYRTALVIVILGGCFCTFSYVFDNALIVIRKQYLLFFSYLISCIYMELSVSYFVKSFGLLGAVSAYTTSMIVFFAVTVILFVISLKRESK